MTTSRAAAPFATQLTSPPAVDERLATTIDKACDRSAEGHDRLCPRQVLGVRLGLAIARELGVSNVEGGKRLLLIAETDGCFVDGLQATTGCTVGHRTLRVVDYGRVAATGIEVETGRALRASPAPGVRDRAATFAHGETRRYYAQLEGYRRMPDSDLLSVLPVELSFDLQRLLGRKGIRVNCSRCGEEVLNGRELNVTGQAICRGCATRSYYVSSPDVVTEPVGGARRE